MAFALIVFGLVLGVSGIQNTQGQLYSNLKNDLFGPSPNFLTWALAIVAIGAIGFVPRLKGVSIGLLVLVGLVVILKNQSGFFSQLTSVLGSSTSTTASNTITPTQGANQLAQDFANQVASVFGSGPATVSNVPLS